MCEDKMKMKTILQFIAQEQNFVLESRILFIQKSGQNQLFLLAALCF